MLRDAHGLGSDQLIYEMLTWLPVSQVPASFAWEGSLRDHKLSDFRRKRIGFLSREVCAWYRWESERDRFLLLRQAPLARKGTQDPPLTKEVNFEGLREHHLEPDVSTQRLGFGERVEPNMLGIVVLNYPLKGFLGKRKPAKHIVLDHHLSS